MSYPSLLAETVSFRGHNGDQGEAYLARPTRPGKFPGVVVIHHMPGWDEWITEVVRKFAHHGFAAISPHLYFRDGPGNPDDIGARVRAAGGVPDDQVVGDVANHLVVGHAARRPHARPDIVRVARAVAEVEMRRDGGKAVMGEFADHLRDPLVPARHMVDDDDAGEFARAGRARQIGLALVAVMAAERNGFREQARIGHAVSSQRSAGVGMMATNSAML